MIPHKSRSWDVPSQHPPSRHAVCTKGKGGREELPACKVPVAEASSLNFIA
jgi:hypothetical protein